jgi:hypothetical protein
MNAPPSSLLNAEPLDSKHFIIIFTMLIGCLMLDAA